MNGDALGGGFEMALACDIIIAADHARLGLPEPRVGLMAGAGGVHRLARMIPQKIAMGYILTGRHMTAQDVHRLGVVNEVVPLAALMPTAMEWANEILECAPLSIRASKQAALMGLGHPLDIAPDELYGSGEDAALRGHGRGTAPLRREANAELEGSLTATASSNVRCAISSDRCHLAAAKRSGLNRASTDCETPRTISSAISRPSSGPSVTPLCVAIIHPFASPGTRPAIV